MVVGPTASGKSQLALELAQRVGGELLCFDSTTVYRGLDIGTAKPSPAERSLCPHHLLDLVEAGQEFSLADFLQQAEASLEAIRRRARQPILVGGTFLYLRAFLEGYQLSQVPADPEYRIWAEKQPLKVLLEELQLRDPAVMDWLDVQNPRRVIRALEVCRSGTLYSQHYRRQPRSEPVRKIGLLAAPDWLQQRIKTRCLQMFEDGFRQEVSGLCEKGLREWLLSMRFIGYPEVVAGLEQSATDEVLAQRVAESTWRLVKKQRTWSRSEGGVDWLQAQDPALVDRAWEALLQPGETNMG